MPLEAWSALSAGALGTDKQIAHQGRKCSWHVTHAEGGDITLQNVPARKARAKGMQARAKGMGARGKVKETGAKAKEIGTKEEKVGVVKNGEKTKVSRE